jgi:hypothetical protein
MAMPQEQLLAAEFMPRRAQEGLPVMPNNGNPRTIYNTPGTGGNTPPEQVTPSGVPVTQPVGQPPVKEMPEKSPYFYPWMAPSPSVDRIRQMIAPRGQPVPMTPTQPISQAPPVVQQTPSAVLPINNAPILPTRRIY